jgi:hypothetical protein
VERTVPSTASEEIDLYQRTYDSLLRTSDEVQIRSLVESHARVQSALHPKAGAAELDVDALVYASLRLPPCIIHVRLTVMGASERGFREAGYPDVSRWQRVSAPGRRRRMLFDGQETLAVYIASHSDVDDLIPILTAYQIEWNKVHGRLHDSPVVARLTACAEGWEQIDDPLRQELCRLLDLSPSDLARLEEAWADPFAATLLAHALRHEKRIAVRLLAGSYVDYRRATRYWWEHIAASVPSPLAERAVYFVSSNTHSLVNLLSGCALRHEKLSWWLSSKLAATPTSWPSIRAIREERCPAVGRTSCLLCSSKSTASTPQGQAPPPNVERRCAPVASGTSRACTTSTSTPR